MMNKIVFFLMVSAAFVTMASAAIIPPIIITELEAPVRFQPLASTITETKPCYKYYSLVKCKKCYPQDKGLLAFRRSLCPEKMSQFPHPQP